MEKKKLAGEAAAYVLLILFAFLLMLPFFWMLSTSFKTPGTEFNMPPQWIPSPFTLENYRAVLIRADYMQVYWNTVKVAFLTVIPTILVTSLAAYSFAKLKFKFRDPLFFLVLALMMVPAEIVLIPNLLLMKDLGWLDRHISVILPQIFGAASILPLFIMRQNFLTLPDEILESAKMDGASQLRIYISLIMPISKAAIAAVTIISFMNSWNMFLQPLIYLNTRSKYLLTQFLASFSQGSYDLTEWTVWMAAVTLSILPIIIVFLFNQKRFIDSMAFSGMK